MVFAESLVPIVPRCREPIEETQHALKPCLALARDKRRWTTVEGHVSMTQLGSRDAMSKRSERGINNAVCPIGV